MTTGWLRWFLDCLRLGLEVISVPVVGTVLVGVVLVVLVVGVVGLTLWAGWSRNRDLSRRDWKDVSRF